MQVINRAPRVPTRSDSTQAKGAMRGQKNPRIVSLKQGMQESQPNKGVRRAKKPSNSDIHTVLLKARSEGEANGVIRFSRPYEGGMLAKVSFVNVFHRKCELIIEATGCTCRDFTDTVVSENSSYSAEFWCVVGASPSIDVKFRLLKKWTTLRLEGEHAPPTAPEIKSQPARDSDLIALLNKVLAPTIAPDDVPVPNDMVDGALLAYREKLQANIATGRLEMKQCDPIGDIGCRRALAQLWSVFTTSTILHAAQQMHQALTVEFPACQTVEAFVEAILACPPGPRPHLARVTELTFIAVYIIARIAPDMPGRVFRRSSSVKSVAIIPMLLSRFFISTGSTMKRILSTMGCPLTHVQTTFMELRLDPAVAHLAVDLRDATRVAAACERLFGVEFGDRIVCPADEVRDAIANWRAVGAVLANRGFVKSKALLEHGAAKIVCGHRESTVKICYELIAVGFEFGLVTSSDLDQVAALQRTQRYDRAATRIQAAYRRHRCQRRYKKMRAARHGVQLAIQVNLRTAAKRRAAATCLQAAWRGRAVRRATRGSGGDGHGPSDMLFKRGSPTILDLTHSCLGRLRSGQRTDKDLQALDYYTSLAPACCIACAGHIGLLVNVLASSMDNGRRQALHAVHIVMNVMFEDDVVGRMMVGSRWQLLVAVLFDLLDCGLSDPTLFDTTCGLLEMLNEHRRWARLMSNEWRAGLQLVECRATMERRARDGDERAARSMVAVGRVIHGVG